LVGPTSTAPGLREIAATIKRSPLSAQFNLLNGSKFITGCVKFEFPINQKQAYFLVMLSIMESRRNLADIRIVFFVSFYIVDLQVKFPKYLLAAHDLPTASW